MSGEFKKTQRKLKFEYLYHASVRQNEQYFTDTIQNSLWRSFLPAAPIHTQWDIFQWNDGMVEQYQAKPGNREAGGFVNSAVNNNGD